MTAGGLSRTYEASILVDMGLPMHVGDTRSARPSCKSLR